MELEIRLLSTHHQRLIRARTALMCDLRWHLHDLWPELQIPPWVLVGQRLQASARMR